MKKANKQNKIEELEGSYTTPHGMTVTLKRLTRMVQGVRFELEAELDDAAMARSPGDLWKKQMLSFHFETTDGQEIHSVNPRKKNYRDSLMTSDHRVIGNGKCIGVIPSSTCLRINHTALFWMHIRLQKWTEIRFPLDHRS